MTKSRSKRPKIQFPNLKELGSVRSVKERLVGPDVIFDNRDKLAQELSSIFLLLRYQMYCLGMKGNIKVKSSASITGQCSYCNQED